MKRLIILGFLTSTLFIFSCASLQQLIQAPVVNVGDVSIKDVTFQDIGLDFGLNINNPNPFGVLLNGFDYQFNLEGNEFLTGNKNDQLQIPPSAATTINIPINLNFKSVYELAQKTKDLDSLNFVIKGNFKPGGVLTGLNIPFSKSGHLPNVRIPKLSFSGLKISKLGFTGVDMILKLDLDNKNIFGFDIGKFDYNIALAGTEVATGTTNKLATIPAKGNGSIELPLSLKFSGLASSLRSVLTGQTIECAINGSTDFDTPFGKMAMPFNMKQNVDILR